MLPEGHWRGSGALCRVFGMVVQSDSRNTVKITDSREYTTNSLKGVKMEVLELINRAKQASGLSLGEMAEELNVHQNRITEWKKGTRRPDAGEIAYFAEKAGLDIAETVMEIERRQDARFAAIWERALGNLRAVAATARAAAAAGVTPTQATFSTTRSRAADVVKL